MNSKTISEIKSAMFVVFVLYGLLAVAGYVSSRNHVSEEHEDSIPTSSNELMMQLRSVSFGDDE
jgi:hypothetical protein